MLQTCRECQDCERLQLTAVSSSAQLFSGFHLPVAFLHTCTHTLCLSCFHMSDHMTLSLPPSHLLPLTSCLLLHSQTVIPLHTCSNSISCPLITLLCKQTYLLILGGCSSKFSLSTHQSPESNPAWSH